MKAKIENGLIVGFEENYHYIKLDPTVYPQLNTPPTVNLGGTSGNFAMLTMVAENNFQESFPRQLLRFAIPTAEHFE